MGGIGSSLPIKLVQYGVSKGSSGQNIESEINSFERFAEVSKGSSFRDGDGQVQLSRTKEFKINFDFSLYPNSSWKILFRGQEWTIQSKELENERQFKYLIRAQSKGGA